MRTILTLIAGLIIGFAASNLVFSDDEVPSTLLGAYYGACLSAEQAMGTAAQTIQQAEQIVAGVDTHLERFGMFRERALEMAEVNGVSLETCAAIKMSMEGEPQ